MRKTVLVVLCGLALVAGLSLWLFWPQSRPLAHGDGGVAATGNRSTAAAKAAVAVAPKTFSVLNTTNPLAFRLANTARSLGQLAAKRHAILLQNALIDTDARLDLKIPAQLRAAGNPGAYIVQARGVVDAPFRALLAAAGASVVSYIPNNAYLVTATASVAGLLTGSPLVQAVLPYEPYYKLQPSLLGLAVNAQPLPPGTALNLGLFAADPMAESQVEKAGAKIIGRDRSAFGPVLRVLAPENWTALAQLPGVQVVEPARQHELANDLSRATVGVAADTQTTTNWLNLDGHNVLVAVNDSSVDWTHPDLTGRVFGAPADLTDFNGHGTHVAGIIAGDGTESMTVSNAQGSLMPPTNGQFRGMAPKATLYSIFYGKSDYTLQTNAALQGALISNNSWDNGDPAYDLAASSYDAATRDALPGMTGSQPVLFVFAAGGAGGGNDNGGGGSSDTIMSPGTAKNVITVGALEQPRGITNIVTTINADGTTNTGTPWFNETDSGSQVAGFSSRGNVGVGTEGSYGRFKPDVVAPGTFVVSTRSGQWDTNALLNPTNVFSTTYLDQTVASSNALNYYNVSVPPNAVAVTIAITANKFSNPFPANLPIYVRQTAFPQLPSTFDFETTKDGVSIPPDGGANYLQQILNNGFDFAVGDSTNVPVHYDLAVTIYTTNNLGDYYQVLLGMDNNDLGPYYRYESGTSMSAAEVSGMLALMQDYFTNTLKLTPSPALLKALLINGARSEGGYSLAFTNGVNFQGWGLPSLPNSLPLTNNASFTAGANAPLFFADQSPLNALATGDSHTYTVNLDTNDYANYLPLQATLVWTDPPGDPAAAIKLVNGLDLIITNLDTGEVYYGNDISSAGYNLPSDTNGPPNVDIINNVQNILLPPLLAGSYSVTVVGRDVNVNAVTAQTNNVVQDYALVVSVGEGEVPTAVSSVTDSGIVSNPTGDQNITFVATTNAPLFNQFAGANTPLLGTANLPLGTNTVWGPNGLVTIGMTNQWHFYVVTNNALDSAGNSFDVTNAAFITFDAYDLAIPRMGVYEDTVANATRPESDIDVYVSTDPGLTNLSPATIANCLAGTINSTADSSGASLGQGGTEFVVFSNSAPGQVYYVGVKSEDQMGSEYAFMPVFTATPFSQLNKNGDQQVNAMLLPVQIPDGDNAHPGVTNVFALAIYPMQINKVIVTNLDEHQNFGDLFGSLSYGTTFTVLNNHDGLGNTFGALPRVYDDSRNPIAGAMHTDGPGSLTDFRGKSAPGLFILSEVDNSLTQTGQVSALSLLIQPHRKLTQPGFIADVPPHGWFIDYVDVPPGYTNLTFFGTNITTPLDTVNPIQMYEKLGNEPTLTDYDQRADLTNGTPPGNTISVGPPLDIGRYFIGLYNPGNSDASVLLSASLGISTSANTTFNYASGSGTMLPDDAVTPVPGFPNPAAPGSTIAVPLTVTQQVASVNVGLVVASPRLSDYTFTLVSPTGQRVLLMENRGGTDTNGAGSVFVYTNVLNTTATGGAAAQTNTLAVESGSSVPIIYNFYTVPDEMTVYAGTNNFDTNNGAVQLLDTGFVSNPPLPGGGAQNTQPVTVNVGPIPPGYTNITIIMNQYGNPYVGGGGDAWIYTAGAPATNYEYLMFTDDTNLATVPIKFAPTPFTFSEVSSNYTLADFEAVTNGDYFGPTNIYDANGGWTVPTNLVTVSTVFDTTNNAFVLVTNVVLLTNNEVSVVTDPAGSLGDNAGSNYLALADGTITRSIPTIPGRIYNVTFWYRGPGIASWWRGEGDATDSSDPEKNGNNGTLVGRFNFPAGEVGQAFQFANPGAQFDFAGTNTYVQIPQNPALDVGQGGGFTVEGWINPTNVAPPQPLVEWLAKVPTNAAVTNLVIKAGPYLDRATGHFYYLLGATNWTESELWAESLGGHLATIDTANEQNWVFDNFANYGGVSRNLWIGQTNSLATTFGWVSGETNVTYLNWLSSQPTNCDGTRSYTFMFGGTNYPAGLWTLADNDGFTCGSPATNTVYGVAEVDQIQTNGVQFWISVTNSPGTTNAIVDGGGNLYTNGCLYANIVDTNYVSHEIYSAPGLIQSNVYQHVALTFDTNSGLAMLYLNGTNVATTNLFLTNGVFTPFVPKTDGDVLLGRDMTLYTNNYFGGEMDEMSIYRRALSGAEIAAIHRVSATATNGLTGKFDPSVTPAVGLAEAEVTFGGVSNLLFGVNNQWEFNSYTFTAASNAMPVQITGLEPGVLLDNFAVSEAPETNLYYLPEEALAALAGDSAAGNWTLQVWDNRVGAYVTNVDQLVNWELSFILESNAMVAAALAPETPSASTVAAGATVYYEVDVPSWAHWATNILVSSDLPVDLLFNPTNLPTGSNPGDLPLLTASTSGVSQAIAVNTNQPYAPYQAGQTYYLGVRNSGSTAASVALEVDYDLTALTNGVPYTSVLTTNTSDAVRYFSFEVSSNAYEATFQLLQLSGNADLVVRKGVPLPVLTNSDYGSFNATNADENIYVLTNSTPVPLSAGTWYLGVFRRDAGPVDYTVLAKELDVTNALTNAVSIIDLTNGVPLDFTAGSGAALTNFFRLSLTNNPMLTNAPGIRFELYYLSGNGDLTVQTNALPLAPPFYQTSQNSGRNPELVLIFTNSVLTNLAADWYLGVPNHEAASINFTILAEIETNNYFPAFPGATGAGGGAAGGGGPATINGHGTNGTVYHVINLNDSGAGSLRDAVSSTNRTVVFDVSGTINLASPLIITNSYLTIAGQTAPGGGITVAGNMTALQSAHDVIIRDVRFRRGAIDDSLQLTNVFNTIADHVSAEWSDTVLSALNSSNVTVQWSIMADSLYRTNNPPPTGSLLRYGSGALSFNHNLYADNYSGSPQLGDNLSLDFVNNVIYNWGQFPGLSGGTNDLLVSTNGCTNQLNYVCNYLIAGADTAFFATNYAITNIAFFGGVTNALAANWIFQTNNFIDSDTNVTLNGADTGWNMFTNQYTQFGRPFPLTTVPTDEAFLAYEKVLDFAGVNLALRDPVDTNIIAKVRNQTGRLIAVPGASPALNSTSAFLDTDQDGAPDFWETTFGQNPTNVDSYLQTTNINLLGYSRLEEYLAWLAGPHALTVTNTPVGVDLQQVFGKTGNLSFAVTNAINGTVYLTNVMDFTNSLGVVTAYTNAGPWSNSIAVFTPTNTVPAYSGYASFDVYVTNTDTVAYFGPVTVSVVVSALPIAYASNTNSPPTFLQTNTLTSLTNVELVPLTITNTATDANTNLTLSYTLTMSIDTNAMSLLGWINPYANTTNTTPVIDANGIITWTPSEAQGPGVYDLTTIVSDNGTPALTATNTFQVTVNESNTPPFWPANVPSQTNYTATPLTALVVTNTAQDSDLPLNPLTYQLIGPTNAIIDTNGIITWTPTLLQSPGTYTFITIVTDTNQYAVNAKSLSATNSFTVNVPLVAPPFAFTQPAQAVTGSSAKLNGMATPNGLPSVAWFEWGTNTTYGTLTPPVAVGTGFNVVYTTNRISGLTTNVAYHFRLVVSNAAGTNYGFDQILDEANVAAWGADYVNQINVPAGLSNAVAVAGAYDHSLALKINGVPVAWGDSIFGQINVPAGLSNALAVAGGEYYSMALKNDNTVAAWGANILGAITNPPAGLSNVVEIAGGTFCGLALKNNGAVIAWGTSFFNLTNLPPGLSNVVAIAGGSYHSLAVLNNGTVAAWGDDSAGQTDVPPGLSNVVAIAAGSYHSLALRYDGTVVAWGDDSAGQTNVPAGLTNVVAVAAGSFHSLALKNDGSLVIWGDNSAGQQNVPLGLTNFVAIAAGNFQSLALTPQAIVNLTNYVVNFTNGVPMSNNIVAGGVTFYQVNVPANADMATNLLFSVQNGALNVWFTTNAPPTIGQANDTLLMGGVASGSNVVLTATTTPRLVPVVYWLGVQNTNSVTVSYGIEVDFHFVQPLTVPISSIIHTNIGGTNGFLLTWFAPSNDLFQVEFTTNLAPANWITFTSIISYNPSGLITPTNAQFNFFDDGVQYPFGPTRFYRLIQLQSANTLTLPAQASFSVSNSTLVTVTNTATDSNSGAALTYSLLTAPPNASISTNGIITWTNAVPSGLAARFTTLVTDNGAPAAQATNTFTVFVMPFPAITNVTVTATNVVLSWLAPTNDQFNVQWTTNLAPPINWTLFSNGVSPFVITSTNGVFSFTDTNAPLLLKFYELILLP